MTSDGLLVAVGTDATTNECDSQLMLLDEKKNIVWEIAFKDSIKALRILNDNAGLIVAVGDRVICYNLQGEDQWEISIGFKAWALDLAPSGKCFAVGTLGGEIVLLDTQGKELKRIDCSERVGCVCFSPDNARLAATVGNNQVLMLDLELQQQWTYETEHALRALTFLPERSQVALISKQNVVLLDEKGQTIFKQKTKYEILSCFVDPQNANLYLAGSDKNLHAHAVYDCRDKAAACYEQADELRKAAELYYDIEKYSEAYNLFKKIGDFSRAADTIHLTGDIPTAAKHYEVVGDYERAATLYEECEDMISAAKCHGQAGNFERAGQLFEKQEDYLLAADFYERGHGNKRAGFLLSKVDQVEQAIPNLETYYESHPADEDNSWQLATLYFNTERWDQAIKLFQNMVESEEHKKKALKRLGQCFLNKNLYDAAIDRLTECLGDEKKPSRDNIDIYYHIGCAYEQSERHLEAKEVFGKVLAIDYYYKDIQKRLKRSEEMSTMHVGGGIGDMPGTAIIADGEDATDLNLNVPKSTQRYRILKKLGQGGMGVVYLANDTSLDRKVAWKVLPSHLASKKEYKERLILEARAIAQLTHQNIVSIYDIITEKNECSITMEFIDGDTLRQRLQKTKQMNLEDGLYYGKQIVAALQAAHQSNIIHRDVKPENILIATEQNRIKMVDFGLARLTDDNHMTREGCVIGTVAYMAPEQIQAREIDGRTDIYALGIVLFEMFTGRTPFIGENILAQHLQIEAPALRSLRADLPETLETLIASCLGKEKEDRPKDCEAILNTLNAL